MGKFNLLAVAIVATALALTQSCTNSIAVDSSMSAVEGNDLTVLLEGCGNQLVVGYTFCRMTEGDVAGKNLTVVGPVSNCERDACVFYTFYDTKGEVIFGGQLPKDRPRALVSWKSLLKRDTFEISDRGFWGVKIQTYWVDADGHERSTDSQGEIRLRVMKQGYKDLHEVENDPNYVWESMVDGVHVKMTTGARAFAAKKRLPE